MLDALRAGLREDAEFWVGLFFLAFAFAMWWRAVRLWLEPHWWTWKTRRRRRDLPRTEDDR